MTGIVYPGVLFLIFYIVNFMMILEESSVAVMIQIIL
jgi:hypothetical protein